MMADRFDEVMGPLAQIRGQIEAVLATHGLTLVQFAVAPGERSPGPHDVQIVAALPEGWQRTELDTEFEEVIASAKQAEVDEKAAAVRAEIERDLRNGNGIL